MESALLRAFGNYIVSGCICYFGLTWWCDNPSEPMTNLFIWLATSFVSISAFVSVAMEYRWHRQRQTIIGVPALIFSVFWFTLAYYIFFTKEHEVLAGGVIGIAFLDTAIYILAHKIGVIPIIANVLATLGLLGMLNNKYVK